MADRDNLDDEVGRSDEEMIGAEEDDEFDDGDETDEDDDADEE